MVILVLWSSWRVTKVKIELCFVKETTVGLEVFEQDVDVCVFYKFRRCLKKPRSSFCLVNLR